MARHLLLFLQADQHTSAAAAAAPPLILLLVVVLVVAAVVVSLCTSSTHAKLWNKHRGTSSAPEPPPQLQAAGEAASSKHLLARLSGIGGRAATVAKMVSWNRRSPAPVGSSDEEVAVVDQEAVWRKSILMGVKCRPFDFSGHLTFDCDGNQLSAPAPVPIKKAAADITET